MTAGERRHDVDRLRVLAMAMMLLRHSARPFNYDWWHVKNSQLSLGMSLFVSVVDQWIMPLFFVLSAASLCFALRQRRDEELVGGRFKRLLVPFIFGLLVLIPPQDYLELASQGKFGGSFIGYIPESLDRLEQLTLPGSLGYAHHLWYLEVLFIFSLLALPLFRYLQSKAAQPGISRAEAFLSQPGAIFLPAVPVAVIDYLVSHQPHHLLLLSAGSWLLFTYLMFFVLGYLVVPSLRLRACMQKQWVAALLLAVVTLAPALLSFRPGQSQLAFPPFVRAINAWFWLVAILGFSSRYLSSSHRGLSYANEAVLPIYMLHQTVIVVIGFYLVRTSIDVVPKFLILSVTSFATIMVLYHLLIRPLNVLRYLFGMKLRAAPVMVQYGP